MRDREEAEISAVVLALLVTVLVSFGIVHQVNKARAARQIQIRKLQRFVAAESARAEAAAAEEYTSMFESHNLCAICRTPTKTRCSRCKAVHYCSSTCQVQHWNQGHKLECKAPAVTCSSVKAGSCKAPAVTYSSVKASSFSENTLDNGITAPKRSSNGNIIKSIADANVIKNSFNRGFTQASYDAVADTRHSSDSAKKCSAEFINKEDEQRRTQDEVARGPPDPAIPIQGKLLSPKKILFPYDDFVKLFSWDMLKPPRGLINCGNRLSLRFLIKSWQVHRQRCRLQSVCSYQQEYQQRVKSRTRAVGSDEWWLPSGRWWKMQALGRRGRPRRLGNGGSEVRNVLEGRRLDRNRLTRWRRAEVFLIIRL